MGEYNLNVGKHMATSKSFFQDNGVMVVNNTDCPDRSTIRNLPALNTNFSKAITKVKAAKTAEGYISPLKKETNSWVAGKGLIDRFLCHRYSCYRVTEHPKFL